MSEAFVVSARKYRPKRFDQVVGQDATTTTLKNAIKSKQLAHAFLFCGSRGVGKTTIARIFAKTINCKDIQADGEACDNCDSCVTFDKNSSFNIIELDAASKNSVDDIRHIVEQVQYPPQGADYKIFIIDEVHMLSQSAFNAFLKTLEEPPAYAKFILATTEKHKILPTILSRCQIYDFKRISITDIENHLKSIAEVEGIEADTNSLNLIAQKADGGLRDALSMFDRLVSMSGKKLEFQNILKSLNILDHDIYFKFIDEVLNENSEGLLLLLNEVISQGFDLEIFLSGFSEHIRNIWVGKKDSTLVLLEYNADIKVKFVEYSSKLDEAALLNLLQIISDCELQLKFSRNRRLVVELALLKMSYLNRLMNSTWTELGEKKKSELSSIPTAIPQSISEIKSYSPQPTSNKGLELADLIALTKVKPVIQIKQEYRPIEDLEIWTKILNKFEGNLMERQMMESLTPEIDNDSFIFTVESEGMSQLIEAQFSSLLKIYSELTGNLAYFKSKVDTSNHVEDISKKEAFYQLAKEYPILDYINETFKLDFNV